MVTIKIQEMKRDPAGVLERVEAGETVVILRDNRAVAEIKPVSSPARQKRPFGLCAGQFAVPEDFDAPLPDSFLSDFEAS